MERHVEAAIRGAAAEIANGSFDPLAHANTLHRDIMREAEAAFDARLPTDTWFDSLERRVRKRWELSQFLSGLGKSGAELFERLQLPAPKAKKEGKNATSRG
jgi:hypothetical protein